MGGKAFQSQGIQTQRLSKTMYVALTNKLEEALGQHFQARVKAPLVCREKKDFGDIDLIVAQEGWLHEKTFGQIVEEIRSLAIQFKSRACLVQGVDILNHKGPYKDQDKIVPHVQVCIDFCWQSSEVLGHPQAHDSKGSTTDHKQTHPVNTEASPHATVIEEGIEVDLMICPPEQFNNMIALYSHHDLSNLAGKIARELGFVWNSGGLKWVLEEAGQPVQEVLVTQHPEEILSFLGYDARRWKKSFYSYDEMFEFISGSPYFNPEIFNQIPQREKLKQARRKTYRLFVDWLAKKGAPIEGLEPEMIEADEFQGSEIKSSEIKGVEVQDSKFKSKEKNRSESLKDVAVDNLPSSSHDDPYEWLQRGDNLLDRSISEFQGGEKFKGKLNSEMPSKASAEGCYEEDMVAENQTNTYQENKNQAEKRVWGALWFCQKEGTSKEEHRQACKEYGLAKAKLQFPEFSKRLREVLERQEQLKWLKDHLKPVYNSYLLGQWTGLKGRELSEFKQSFEAHYPMDILSEAVKGKMPRLLEFLARHHLEQMVFEHRHQEAVPLFVQALRQQKMQPSGSGKNPLIPGYKHKP